MKRSLKELLGYTIHTKDGTKGSVEDFLFDEESWTIRYMMTDLGNLFVDKKLLIPRVFFEDADWGERMFNISMTKDELKNSPTLDEHQPVSRKHEELLNKFHSIDNYWTSSYAQTFGVPSMITPPHNKHKPPRTVKDEDIDTSLRSFKEIKGYRVECLDQKDGTVADCIVDTESWKNTFIIIDLGKWYTKSKQVMLPVDWISEINYKTREIRIHHNSEVLEQAPEFDPSIPVNVEHERNVYDYYGRKVINV